MNFTLDPRQNELESRLLERIAEDGATEETVRLFRDLILSHYRTSGRDLPWRRTADPPST